MLSALATTTLLSDTCVTFMGAEDTALPLASRAVTVKTFTAFCLSGTGIENCPPSPGTVPLFVTPAPFTCTLTSARTGTAGKDIKKSTMTKDNQYREDLLMRLIILLILTPY